MPLSTTLVIGGTFDNQCISTHSRNENMHDKNDFPKHQLSSANFGAKHGVKGESVRSRYYKTGSYFGVIPLRAPNGRLLWPDESNIDNQK